MKMKKMKNKIGLVIGVVVLAFLVFTASAAAQTSINVESATVDSGDTFTINVTLSNTPASGISAYGFNITFDPNVVQVKNVTNLPAGYTISNWNNDTGWVKIGGALTPAKGDGVYGTITFKAVGANGTSTTLDMTVEDLTDGDNVKIPEANYTVTDGSITVGVSVEIHDINVTTDYTGAVNGIKITRDGTDVVGADENLTVGETYKIRYKIVNEGDFDETAIAVTVKINDEVLATHTYSLAAGDFKTYSDEWDTTGLTAGVYTITVNASIADDANPADNERTREVVLETAAEQVPVSDAEDSYYKPDIALSNAGNIYVAFEGTTGIDFAKSTNGGASFNTQIPVSTAGEDAAVAAYDGNVYIVWCEDYKIYYARSTDGGDSFETKVQVNDGGSWNEEPDVAVNSSGAIYVVWEDDGTIYIDKSTDGTAFGTDVIVNDSFIVVEKPSIAIDSDDNILVAWSGRMGGMTNHVYLAKSTDGGATFSAAVRVSAEDTEARYPSVVVDPTDSSKIYVAWVDYGEDAAGDIYVATSSDGGANFGTGVKVNDDTADAEQKFPCMAVNSTGAVFVVWQDGRNYESDYDIYFAGSTDGGNSFSANRKVNPDDTKAVTPTLAVDDTNAFVAWRNTDDQRIYFRKMPLVAPVPEKVLTTITVSPETANLTVNKTQVFTATAYDQDGNPMADVVITWTSSNETVGTVSPASATTDSDGKATTTFTALKAGTTTITAASGDVSGTAEVTVTAGLPKTGDFNDDDTVNMQDAIYLVKYLYHIPGYEELYPGDL